MPENDIREIPKHDIHVKGTVKQRSLAKDLGKGVMEEIIVPKSLEVLRDMFNGVISMFSDALHSGVDKVLYPDGNVPTRRSSNNSGIGRYTGTTNYTSYSKPINDYKPQSKPNLGQRGGNEVNYIWVPTEEDAKQIVGALKEDVQKYGKAKVATLYEMLRTPTTFADFKYGWTDVSQIGYYEDHNRRPGEDKWFLDLAKPVDITEV